MLKTIARWAVRLFFLAAALLLLWGGPVGGRLVQFLPKAKPEVLLRAVPSASPLAAFLSTLAQRRWYLTWFWLASPLVLLLLGFWKGRVFCRWACPVGTVYAIPSKLTLKKNLLKVRVSGYLFWIIVFASLVGAPLLLLLDPLSTLNRLAPLLRGTYTVASLVPGLLLPVFLLLGFVQPLLWCTHICPLGYFLGLTNSLRRQPKQTFRKARRQILTGLAIGVPVAVAARAFGLAKEDSQDEHPVLPPGAVNPADFAAICTRCYACVAACPTGIIRVGFVSGRRPGQWLQPEMDYFDSEETPDMGYCPEPCNACSGVCPAGALRPLTFQEKWHRQMGVAKIIREACLAWEDGEHCAVCQEVCSYQAIDFDETEEGPPRPVVDESKCRGCGACYSKCPAIRIGKAIVICGVPEQRDLPT